MSLGNTIAWSRGQDANDYFFIDELKMYNIAAERVANHLREKVKANGNRIFFASYKVNHVRDGWKLKAISAVQLNNEPVVHAGICLGDNVAFLAIGDGVNLYQQPSSFCTWDMCELPFTDVDLGVRIVVLTVLECWEYEVQYNCHVLENIEHMLCRLMSKEHKECDVDTSGDYDFDSPQTWTKGVQCSQLTLLVLKRCVKHGALEIADATLKEKFMGVYSHTCCPGFLHRLVDEVWPQSTHYSVKYNWKTAYADFRERPTQMENLLSTKGGSDTPSV